MLLGDDDLMYDLGSLSVCGIEFARDLPIPTKYLLKVSAIFCLSVISI